MCTSDNKLQKEVCDLKELNEALETFESHTIENPVPVPSYIYWVPFNKDYEIAHERLTIDKDSLLHSGKICLTHIGNLKMEDKGSFESLKVAVRSIKSPENVNYFKTILCEIKLLTFLGHHENIVSILGTVTEDVHKGQVHIVTDYCERGNLQHYLQLSVKHFWDLWNSENQNPEEKYENVYRITTLDLLRWSIQIANGMIFLGEKNVVHGNLTIENIFLTADNVVKIGNFTISGQLIECSNDLNEDTAIPISLPWRYVAMECFTEFSMSIYSDIWSFGVTLWSIFTLGNVPYQTIKNVDFFILELGKGLRPDPPTFGNQEIYQLILDCMKPIPKDRLPFSKIMEHLKNMEKKLRLVLYYVCCS